MKIRQITIVNAYEFTNVYHLVNVIISLKKELAVTRLVYRSGTTSLEIYCLQSTRRLIFMFKILLILLINSRSAASFRHGYNHLLRVPT